MKSIKKKKVFTNRKRKSGSRLKTNYFEKYGVVREPLNSSIGLKEAGLEKEKVT